MNKYTHRTAAVVVLVVLTFAGCGDDTPDMGTVTGTVTYKGKPVDKAYIEFQPDDENSSASYGGTDDNGRYELLYNLDHKGATIGKHTVRITTARMVTKDDLEEEIPEMLPDKYHAKTELVREVKPGENVIDFKLD